MVSSVFLTKVVAATVAAADARRLRLGYADTIFGSLGGGGGIVVFVTKK